MKKRADGRYVKFVTVTVNDKKTRKSFYGKSIAEVNRKILAYQEHIETGETFETVADLWWEEAEKAIAYNTTKGYKPAYRRAVDRFGEIPIRTIKPTDISRFLRNFIKSKDAADKTARTQLMVVNLICRYGVENGYLDSNPARDVSVPSGLKRQKRTMPEQADIEIIKKSTGCTFGMFPLWLIYTGCRKGELLALQWEDIDFRKKTISISKSVFHINNKPAVKEPKTESGTRVLPLMAALEKQIKPGKGLLFPDPDGGYMTEDHYQDLWRAYQQETGTCFTAHQIRHAYATLLIENDIAPTDAQYFLGHAQLSTTMDIYREYRDQQKEKARQAVIGLNF